MPLKENLLELMTGSREPLIRLSIRRSGARRKVCMRPMQANAANKAGMAWKSCVNCPARMLSRDKAAKSCENSREGSFGRSV
jgi:hypothetical protein